MRAKVMYPPNTTKARAAYDPESDMIIVDCPHCGQVHFHTRAVVNRLWIRSACGKGHYVLAMQKPETSAAKTIYRMIGVAGLVMAAFAVFLAFSASERIVWIVLALAAVFAIKGVYYILR